jgi:predicted acetyltransferase
MSVHGMPMRIGSVEVRMGGIGGVWTDKDHRKKGYASIVMSDGVAWMREQGYDLSVLFGIGDFYWRWGFITTLAAPFIEVKTRHAEAASRTCRARKYRDSDLGDYLRIYNRENRTRTASIVRRKSSWIALRKGLNWGQRPEAFVYTKARKPVGVAAYSLAADMVACVDLCARSPEAFGGVLRHAADLAIERRVEKIAFHIPVDCAFAEFCREQGCEIAVNVPRVAGGMARIINQGQTFEKIAPELSRRLAASRLHAWNGTIAVKTDLDTTPLAVRRGKVSLAKGGGRASVTLACPQERLTQLLFGFQSVRFCLAHTKTQARGRGAADVLAALFPRGEPFMWVPDHF